MAAVPGAAGPSGAAGTPRSTSGDLWLVSWLRQWTYPTEGFLVGVARSQLITALMLSLYCIFNGLFASSADSGLFYFLQVPLTVVLFYAIRSADREREAIKLMNVYIGGTMLLALVSSLYFVVLSNHIQIAYRECSRIGGPFPALYSAAECVRVIRFDKGRIARVAVFVLVQVACIHPAVSFRIHVARVLRRAAEAAMAADPAGRGRPTSMGQRSLSGPAGGGGHR